MSVYIYIYSIILIYNEAMTRELMQNYAMHLNHEYHFLTINYCIVKCMDV